MIIKEKVLSNSSNPKLAAGEKQELDVSFYLRRAFKDNPDVSVFNDIKLTHNNETAQIDHLIVYKFGFVIIESKSISGEVSINQHDEWSRSYNGKWFGMPSPIKQAELQAQVLKSLLNANCESILPSKLLGVLQKGFSGREWNIVCAVSSNSIIERSRSSEELSSKLVKTEFIADKLIEIMDLYEVKGPKRLIKAFNDNRVWFKRSEIELINEFVLRQDESLKCNSQAENSVNKAQPGAIVDSVIPSLPNVNSDKFTSVVCKSCKSKINLTPKNGRYGYYLACGNCNTNTPMKQACPACTSKKTNVKKNNCTYELVCNDCNSCSILDFEEENTVGAKI